MISRINPILFSHSCGCRTKLFCFRFIQIHDEWTNINETKVHQLAVLLDSFNNFADLVTMVIEHKELWIGVVTLAIEEDVGNFGSLFEKDLSLIHISEPTRPY